MDVVINGEDRTVAPRTTLRHLLPDPAGHAVAVNGTVVPRADHPRTVLTDGDVVEIVTAVQGG